MSGYGFDSYGLGVYGSVDVEDPYVASVSSVSGYQIEVVFSEQVDENNPALTLFGSYTFTPIVGAATFSITSIEATSSTTVLITHSGSTLGGTYSLSVTDITDMAGNEISSIAVSFYAKGDVPDYTITPNGFGFSVSFAEELLPVIGYPLTAVETVSSNASYDIEQLDVYPIIITYDGVTFPFGGNDALFLQTTGQTNLSYAITIGVSDAINYLGDVLVDDYPGGQDAFTIGGSTALGLSGLEVTIPISGAGTYTAIFEDQSGRLTTDSTFRYDLTCSPLGTISPVPDTLLSSHTDIVSATLIDGTIDFKVQLGWTGSDYILTVLSGGISLYTSMVDWYVSNTTISLIRNQKSERAIVLLNGDVVFTTDVVNLQPSIYGVTPSVIFALNSDSTFSYTDFVLNSVVTTASHTIFTNSWNFIHQAQQIILGSPANANDRVRTQYGPLVKDWGDWTPATKNDVAVYVQGIEVEVFDVNPYAGEIFPTVAIPLLSPGDIDVKVDYNWIACPIFEFAQLNEPGLVLNKYDLPVSPYPSNNFPVQLGAPDLQRFTYSLVLPSIGFYGPRLISHRFLGFEREYTASINSPTTLLLNQTLQSPSVDSYRFSPTVEENVFDGNTNPQNSWALYGQDNGELLNDGTYVLKDTSTNDGAFYASSVSVGFPQAIRIAARLAVSSYTKDGVFTGIGFGFHNGHTLYFFGFLEINGANHYGFLKNPNEPYLVQSWEIEPTSQLTITAANTATASASDIPRGLRVGSRFQVLSGSQTGIYTVSNLVLQSSGKYTISVTPNFPANYKLYGNRDIDAVFEVDFNEVATYVFEINPEANTALLSLSGRLQFQFEEAPPMPHQAYLNLPYFNGEMGYVFWGSLSRQALNESIWSFIRYNMTPDATQLRGHNVYADTQMDALPEESSPIWAPVGLTGTRQIQTNALQLNSISSSFGYGRTEPFLGNDGFIDLRFEFSSSYGQSNFVIDTGYKHIELATLRYAEDSTRRLIFPPTLGLVGYTSFVSQGGTQSNPFTISAVNHEHYMEISGRRGGWTFGISDSLTDYLDDEGGRLLDLRFQVTSGGQIGIFASLEFGSSPNFRTLVFTLISGFVRLQTSAGIPVQDYAYSLDDVFHSYRIIADHFSDTVSVYIDDTLQIPSLLGSSFSGGSTNTHFSFGVNTITDTGSEPTLLLESIGHRVLEPSYALHTFGLLKNVSNRVDINSYEIPRTDSSPSSNSVVVGTSVEVMDWTNSCEVRLIYDSEWGAVFLRPDLALPPYYQPESSTPGTGYITHYAEPSAGWINLEFRDAPKANKKWISFGCGESVTLNQIDYVTYRLAKHWKTDLSAPRENVLNRYNVLDSGDLSRDVSLEQITATVTDNVVHLRSYGINAKFIYKVVDGSITYAYNEIRFDIETQTITRLLDVNETPLPFTNQSVTVVFSPGKPITESYLLSQPVNDGTILLNERTPVFEFSEVSSFAKVIDVNTGDANSFSILDHTRTGKFESVNFYQIYDQGQLDLISFPCEDQVEFAFSEYEDGPLSLNDNTPPSDEYTNPNNPDGVSSPSGNGAAYAVLTIGMVDTVYTLYSN